MVWLNLQYLTRIKAKYDHSEPNKQKLQRFVGSYLFLKLQVYFKLIKGF